MTARTQGRTRPAPRIVLRVARALHRTLYRVTGGRMGRTRPEAGKRFGILRLATVGGRSAPREAHGRCRPRTDGSITELLERVEVG